MRRTLMVAVLTAEEAGFKQSEIDALVERQPFSRFLLIWLTTRRRGVT